MREIRRAASGLFVFAVVIALSAAGWAGNLAGKLQDPMGVGLYEEAVNCNDAGNSTWGGSYWTSTPGAFSF